MPGLFQGIEIGKRALMTHQTVLQTIGHNIANVNTPGYTRQRVRIEASLPEAGVLSNIGSGVETLNIQNIRDLFLGEQYRADNKSLGQWTYKQKMLAQVESMFGEPNDGTFVTLLNKFWDSWSNLSTNPESTTFRAALLEDTNLLTNGFHQIAGQLESLRKAVDTDLDNMVEDVNRITTEISRLNQQISRQEVGDDKANDLRDARDLLIDELSSLIDVNSFQDGKGQFIVSIGAMELVNGPDTNMLEAKPLNENGKLEHKLLWKGSTISLTNIDGQLKGLIDMRDKIIPDMVNQIDTLASQMIASVNQIHRQGYGLDGSTNLDFFDSTFTSAATIRLNFDVVDHTERIAASASGEAGDNVIALQMQGLRNAKTMVRGSATMNEFYNSVVGELGVMSGQAQSFATNYELLVQQIDNTRQSVQGVSLDEEMTNMVKFQHAYDAAARVVTVMDQALSTVIGTMGIVGR